MPWTASFRRVQTWDRLVSAAGEGLLPGLLDRGRIQFPINRTDADLEVEFRRRPLRQCPLEFAFGGSQVRRPTSDVAGSDVVDFGLRTSDFGLEYAFCQ